MTLEDKIKLITQNTEEVLTKEDLKKLLSENTKIKHYIGFEISGKIHLGTGLACMMKVKDLVEAGVEPTIFLADWHTWINDKLGGNREVIKKVALEYFQEGIKASFECIGGDPDKLNFVLGSDLYHDNDRYWETMIEVCKYTTLSRIKRSITILGRKEGENIDFAKLIYPPMQVADIFNLHAHIAHSGLDQRKAQVIARNVALKLKVNPLKDNNGEKIKPVALHHHLILGLGKPPIWPLSDDVNLQDIWASFKMSKSKPDTCIFIHDSVEEIEIKINKAFCPEGEVRFNPILDWTKHLILPLRGKLEVERPVKFGGDIVYKSFDDLGKDFKEKKLHPVDLKRAVSREIVSILEPARRHFSSSTVKKGLDQLEKLFNND